MNIYIVDSAVHRHHFEHTALAIEKSTKSIFERFSKWRKKMERFPQPVWKLSDQSDEIERFSEQSEEI